MEAIVDVIVAPIPLGGSQCNSLFSVFRTYTLSHSLLFEAL